MEIERVERELLCDNCHKDTAHIRIRDIGMFRKDLVLCQGCLGELRELLIHPP